MNLVILLVVALGIALLIHSYMTPVPVSTVPASVAPKATCNEIDFVFQRNLQGGLLDRQDRRHQIYDRLSKLMPEVRRINEEISNLYEDMHTALDQVVLPDNFQELEYQYGQKLITKPFEDRHRDSRVPNFERPTFA